MKGYQILWPHNCMNGWCKDVILIIKIMKLLNIFYFSLWIIPVEGILIIPFLQKPCCYFLFPFFPTLYIVKYFFSSVYLSLCLAQLSLYISQFDLIYIDPLRVLVVWLYIIWTKKSYRQVPWKCKYCSEMTSHAVSNALRRTEDDNSSGIELFA